MSDEELLKPTASATDYSSMSDEDLLKPAASIAGTGSASESMDFDSMSDDELHAEHRRRVAGIGSTTPNYGVGSASETDAAINKRIKKVADMSERGLVGKGKKWLGFKDGEDHFEYDAENAPAFVPDDDEGKALYERVKGYEGATLSHHNRPMRINRNKDGKAESYSTTASTVVPELDGTWSVIPTMWKGENGETISAIDDEEAATHYRNTEKGAVGSKVGERYGNFKTEAEAKAAAQEIHELHSRMYQQKWNQWLHEHWDEVPDNIKNDPEMAKVHAAWERAGKPGIRFSMKNDKPERKAGNGKGEGEDPWKNLYGSNPVGVLEKLQLDLQAKTGKKYSKGGALLRTLAPMASQSEGYDANMRLLALEALRSGDYTEDEEKDLLIAGGIDGLIVPSSKAFPEDYRREIRMAAEGAIADITANKQSAGAELHFRPQTNWGKFASGSLTTLGYGNSFIYGSAIMPTFKIAQGAGMAAKLIKGGLNSVSVGAPAAIAGGVERGIGLATKSYEIDELDRIKAIDDNFDGWTAGIRGAAGGVAENIVVEGLVGAGLDAAFHGLAQLPIVKSALEPLKKMGSDAVRKMWRSSSGRALIQIGRITKTIGQVSNFHGLPAEMLEENIQPIFDDVLGLDRRKGEKTDTVGEYLGKTFNWERQGDIFLSLVGVSILHGAMGFAAYKSDSNVRKFAKDAKTARKILVGDAEQDRNRVDSLTDEEAIHLANIYQSFSEDPKLAMEIARKMGEATGEMMDSILSREGARMGGELEDMGAVPVKFMIPTRQGLDGNKEVDFQRMEITNHLTGETAERNVVVDEDTGVYIIDNDAPGTDSAFTVRDDVNGKSIDVMSIAQARQAATNLMREHQLAYARDNSKMQYILNLHRRKYGNVNIEQYATVDEAVAAGLRHGVDVSRNAAFNPSRMGWRLNDGTVILVRDNIKSPWQVDKLLRHEAVGHSKELNDIAFLDDVLQSKNEISRASERYLKNGPVVGGTDRAIKEAVVNTIQQYPAMPTKGQKFVHAVKNLLKSRGFDLGMSDPDIEVEVAKVADSLKGDGGNYDQEPGRVYRGGDFVSFNKKEETNDETGHGADETLTQPEQGEESVPTEGEAARPVEGESERSETSEVVDKPVPSRSVIEKMTDKAPVQELPVSEVFNDDVRIPNFKEGANPETGEVEPLTGEPYDLVSNPIVVMEFKDGKKVVVTGRHRLALYKRSGRDKIAARVIREADGWTVNDAKMIDSIGNIIDEKGSVKDYVRYFEDAKPSREAAEAGGFLARAKGKLAFGIYESATEDTRSSIDWEGSGADGMISVDQAGIIAEAAPKNEYPRNKALQRILVAKALNGLRGKKLGILARSLAEEVKRQKNVGDVGGAMQLDLFSSAEDQALLAMEDKRADYRAKKAREYGKIAEDLRTALRKGGRLDINKNYAKELGITDPKDKKQIAAARDKAVQKANYWENAVRLDDADKVAMDAELGFSPIAETPAKKSGDSPSVADNKPNTTKKPQETTVERTEAAGRENTRPNAETRPEAVSGANAGRSGSAVRKVNPTAPNFKRGERVFLKGTTSKQTVTFLKANADGTVDVQVRTPGANRYAPTTAKTRTVPAADVSATGLKDTLSVSEKEALKRGMEGEFDEQWINGQKGALTERGRKILDYVNSIVGKTFERKGADGSRTVEKVLRITPKGNVRLLQNIWEADGTQSVKDREYTQFASQARYNQDGWQEVEDKVSFMSDEFSPNARREYDEVYNHYHNTDGTAKPGWMKAPNGKPTKLSERQWVQVRTPSFKKWFGDWENVELQNWLENSSVATATGKEYADIPKAELEDAIVSYFADKGIRSVENENVGKVNITRSGIHDSIAKGVGRMKIAAFNHLPEIISNGRVVAQETNWKERGYNTVTLAAPIEIGNKKHVALVTIRQYPNHDNNFYLHEVGLLDEIKREAERLYDTGLSPNGDKEARPLGSMRKIAQSLFAVNPSSVSKVVDENGEPMVVYHGTNNNFTVFSAEKMRPGAYGDGFYFATTPERARLYGDRIISVFLNAKADNRDAKRLGVEKDYIRTSAGDVIVKNPKQIKSATDNNGDFSQTENDIRFMSDEFDEDAELEGKFDPETASLFVRPPINREEVRTPFNPLGQVVPPEEGSVAQSVDKEIAEDEARVARSRGTPRGIPPPPAPGSQSNPTLDPGYEPESIGAGVADPISRQEIVDKFRELFSDEVAIRGANTTRIGKNYAGHYEPDTGIIRTKNPVSLRTIPHELGHYIEDVAKRTGVLRMNSVRRDLEALGKELYGDKKPPNGYESEGVAELVKYYLQGNDAGLRSRHIAAYHWLVIDFGKKNPDVMERLDALRDMIDRLQNQSGDDAVRGIRTKGGSFSKQPSLAERAEKLVTDAIEGTKKALTPTAENWIDQGAFIMKGMRASGLDKLMDWQKALKDGDTAKMNDIIENHPALKYKLYNGKAAARAYQALEKGVTDLSGTRRYTYGDLGVDTPGHNANELIPTFKEIFGDFTASEMDEFENYAIARIAKEAYLDKGLEFGLTKKEVMPTIIKHSRNTKFQNALDRYTHYKHAVLHLLVDSGAMSQEQFEQIVAANPIYVRITRRHDDADLFRKRMQQKRGKAVNRRTGSGRQVEDIFDAGLVNDERIFAAAFQADLLRSLINLGKRGEKAGGVAEGLSVGANWLREVPNAQGAVTFTAEKLRKQITEAMQNAAVADGKADADNIFDQLFSDGKDTLTIFKEKPSNGKNGLVSLYDEDGKLHTYELPQNNAEGWAKGLMGFTDASKPNILEQWAQMAAAATRAGATVLNPTFAVRNIVRDTLHASVVNEYGSYIPGVSTVEGVVMDLFGSKAKDIFDAMGIPMGSLLGEAKLTSAKRANRYLMSRNWFEAQWNKGVKKAIADVVGFSENATRVKEFQLVRDYMLKNGASEKAANMLAAANALDITIDFQRGGETTKRLNRIIPFFNAAVQGLEQTTRAFGIAKAQPWQLHTSRRRRLARTVIQGGAWLMSLAIASMLYNYSDEERRRKYRELKPHEKWNYFNFGDFRLPVPYEFGYIFASIPSAVVAEMSGDKGAVAECLGMMKKSLPGFSPTDIAGLGPLLSAAMNESWTGAAIVPEHIMRTKESYDWYDSRTSEFSKRLAKAFHKFFGNGKMASPAHIDYVLNAWTGNMFGRTIGSIGKQSAFDASRPNTYPIFGTFFRNPATSSRVVGDFHERRLDLTRRKGSDNISDEELKELERRNVVAKTLTELRKESQAVRNDPLLSAKERNDRLEKLAEQSRAAVKTLSEDYHGNDPVVKETAYKLVKKEFETAKKELDSVRKDNTLGWKAKNARIAQMRNANALLKPNVEDRIQGLISEERKTLAQVKFWQDMLKYMDNTPNTPKKDRQSALSNIAKLEAVAGRLRDDVMKIAREAATKPSSDAQDGP